MKIQQITKGIKQTFAKKRFRRDNQITYLEARKMIQQNSLTILLDVRSKQEYDEYHLEGAICIPTYELVTSISKLVINKEQAIIVYCQSGARSKKAENILSKMGYKNVYEIKGGIDNL